MAYTVDEFLRRPLRADPEPDDDGNSWDAISDAIERQPVVDVMRAIVRVPIGEDPERDEAIRQAWAPRSLPR